MKTKSKMPASLAKLVKSKGLTATYDPKAPTPEERAVKAKVYSDLKEEKARLQGLLAANKNHWRHLLDAVHVLYQAGEGKDDLGFDRPSPAHAMGMLRAASEASTQWVTWENELRLVGEKLQQNYYGAFQPRCCVFKGGGFANHVLAFGDTWEEVEKKLKERVAEGMA